MEGNYAAFTICIYALYFICIKYLMFKIIIAAICLTEFVYFV